MALWLCIYLQHTKLIPQLNIIFISYYVMSSGQVLVCIKLFYIGMFCFVVHVGISIGGGMSISSPALVRFSKLGSVSMQSWNLLSFSFCLPLVVYLILKYSAKTQIHTTVVHKNICWHHRMWTEIFTRFRIEFFNSKSHTVILIRLSSQKTRHKKRLLETVHCWLYPKATR